MTTGWLLLLLMLVVSSQSVDGQSATNCDAVLLNRILDNQRQILQTLQQQHQAVLKHIGKCLSETTLVQCSCFPTDARVRINHGSLEAVHGKGF